MPTKDPCVTVRLNGRENVVNIPAGANYEQLLLELKLNPEEVLIFVDNEPVPFDAPVQPGTVRRAKSRVWWLISGSWRSHASFLFVRLSWPDGIAECHRKWTCTQRLRLAVVSHTISERGIWSSLTD